MAYTPELIHSQTQPAAGYRPHAAEIERRIERRSFAVLSTVSPAGSPHAAGVLYERVGGVLFINTLATSRKARNIAAQPRVALSIPVRRLPVGPPSSIQFQTRAELLAASSPEIQDLVDAGKLRSLTSHGELDLPDSVFVRIELPVRVNTYGLGMPLRTLIKDPLSAAGSADLSHGEAKR